jgi:hypothetical protein
MCLGNLDGSWDCRSEGSLAQVAGAEGERVLRVARDRGAKAVLLRRRDLSFPFTGIGAGAFCFCRVADLLADVAIAAF